MFLIYTLVFLGFFAGALVSPVLSPMFLHPQEHGVLPDSATVATRAFLLGLAMSMMRLGEFFGSPVLGQLSDHLGRKLVLAGALGITAIGNLAIGVAIQEEQVWIIVAGQFFIGFAGVLLVLAQSEIAANCEGSIKTQRFGYIYLASSLAYVFAPVLGGHLADTKYFSFASYSLPFYVAASICVLCVLLVLWKFPHSPSERPNAKIKKSALAENWNEWKIALQMRTFRSLLIVNFFIYLGIDFVFQFNPVFFVQHWNFTSAEVGWLMSYTSISMVVTQWLLIKPVGRRWTPRLVTAVSAIALGTLLILEILPQNWRWLIAILPFVGMAMAMATTNMSTLLSNTATQNRQGQMLGIAHSVRVLGSAILCLLGGILAGFAPQYPILFAAVACVFAATLLLLGHRKIHQQAI